MKKTENKNQKTFWKLITGPMFAGKTKHLIQEIKYFRKKIKVESPIFKPYIDNRVSGNIKNRISTHNLFFCKAIVIKKNEEIWNFIQKSKKTPKLIFLSELSLFPEGIIDVLKRLKETGISIICEGINKDYQGNYLPAISKIQKEDIKIKTLYTNCNYCFKKAEYSKRTVAKKEIIMIGGKESYKPACESCWKTNI